MDSYILGLSCYYHDSAVALLKNGEIVSAVQEERFSRKKHDSRFPKNALLHCLKSQNISLSDVSSVVYYEKPLLTFERLLETYSRCTQRCKIICRGDASLVEGKTFFKDNSEEKSC